MKLSECLLLSFDTETTGVDVDNDRVVQVATAYHAYLDPRGDRARTVIWETLVNPGVPIPPPATAVHGIDDARVSSSPTFGAIAAELHSRLRGSLYDDATEFWGMPVVLTGYNVCAYDVPLLAAEFKRLSSVNPPFGDLPIVDPIVFVNWHHRSERGRKLVDACRGYRVPLDNAHQASADCLAAAQLLRAMVVRGMIPDDVELAVAQQRRMAGELADEWARFSYFLYAARENGALNPARLVVGFGKHCGTPVDEMDAGYLEWCLANLDCPEPVRTAIDQQLRTRAN